MAISFSDTQSSSDKPGLRLILVANTPQFLLSITYLLFNSLLTIMLAEKEWHTFGPSTKPKSVPRSGAMLRVSPPRGNQRSTFFLSLPYKYALPLLAVSSVLQWLVSQGLFYAEVDLWNANGQRKSEERGFMTLGTSFLTFFWVIILSTVRRFPREMPLLGACSAVIAASCHLPKELQSRADTDVTLCPIAWGVLSEPFEDGPGTDTWVGLSTG